MSDYNIFLFISVVTTFVKVTVGYELEDYKLYAIQNSEDNTVYRIFACKFSLIVLSSLVY